jgi:hypothetical protein
MFQVQFPSSGLDEQVDGQTVVANDGAGWSSYHVDVSYLLYNHWAGVDWNQLPSTDYQNDFQSHGAVGTLSQRVPVLDDSAFASPIDQGSSSQSYRGSASSLPSDVSPNSPVEPEYDEYDHHEAIEPLTNRYHGRQTRSSEQTPSKISPRRKSTVEDDTSQSDEEQTSHSRTGSKSESCPVNKLERNRLAAKRCRIRKRAEVEALKSKKNNMEKRHMKLASEAEKLTDEAYQLKRELLLHADCNCTLIQKFIKNGFRRDGGEPRPQQK